MSIFDSESEVEEEGEIICIVLEIECFSEEFLKGELILREFLEDKDRDQSILDICEFFMFQDFGFSSELTFILQMSFLKVEEGDKVFDGNDFGFSFEEILMENIFKTIF